MKILNYACLPRETRSGEMNFIGAVMAFFDEFASDLICDEHTKGLYISNYNETIFPIVDLDLPIAEYNRDVLNELEARLQRENKIADITMRSRYHHLIFAPYKSYIEWLLPEWHRKAIGAVGDDLISAGERLLKIPRTLTPKQELIACLRLLGEPKTSDGVRAGLAEMFIAALRNSEACGLNFGDMKELTEHPGRYYLEVYETTIGNRNKTQSGGKTGNAPRRVPIPRVLSDFIKAREEFVSSQVSFPCQDKRGRKFNSIKDLPIACRGTDYAERCGAGDLTEAGKRFLCEELRFSEEKLTALSEIIAVFADVSEAIEDREPTTYIFRRNAGTHLFQLGFTSLQIYAYMGHDLRDELIERSDLDDEILYEMSCLLDNHPLNPKREREVINMTKERSVSRENVTDLELILPAGKKYQIFVKNRETNDAVEVTIEGGSGTAIITTTNALEPPSAEINITKAIRRYYEKIESELKGK